MHKYWLSLCNSNYRGYGLYIGHILSLLTYLLSTSISGRVPGYLSYYPTGTRENKLPGYGSASHQT